MWISKAAWVRVQTWFGDALRTERVQVDWLRTQLAAALETQRVYEQRNQWLQDANASIRERLIEAEAGARAAKVRADLFTLRVNQLQSERDQYLQKVLSPDFPIQLVTPQITGPVVRPHVGVDFEDMGDERAKGEGFDDLPLDPVETLEGLGGRVYDPSRETTGAAGFDSMDSPYPVP